MCSNPPGPSTSASPLTNTGRSSSAKVWNSPQSITVSNCRPSFFNSRALPTMKCGVDTSLSGFGLGPLDGNRHEVEAPRFVASGRQIEEIFAGAAAHVENTATNLASFGQFDDCRLRPSRVPRCLTLIHLLE